MRIIVVMEKVVGKWPFWKKNTHTLAFHTVAHDAGGHVSLHCDITQPQFATIGFSEGEESAVSRHQCTMVIAATDGFDRAFGGGKGLAFLVRATSNRTSLGGGEQKFCSLYICTASLTSSMSIIFFLA